MGDRDIELFHEHINLGVRPMKMTKIFMAPRDPQYYLTYAMLKL